MAGGHGPPQPAGGWPGYPPGVWSPSGGWYADPKNWKRNTIFAFGAAFVMGYFIFQTSIQLEQRPIAPSRPIPSQMWCKNFPKEEASE